MSKDKKSINVGDIFVSSNGCEFVVLSYDGCKRVLVKFLDSFGYETYLTSGNIVAGRVGNPYRPSVCGVGYIGESDRSAGTKNKKSRSYLAWQNMLNRCYNEDYHKGKPTYLGCAVDPVWLNYQNFRVWFESQFGCGEVGYQLDKDILIKGNKIYSPETCCLVPSYINSVMSTCRGGRGLLPIGVTMNRDRYGASVSKRSKRISLGTYDTPEEAHKAYAKGKEDYIKYLVECEYSYLPEHIKQALLNYRVEITD